MIHEHGRIRDVLSGIKYLVELVIERKCNRIKRLELNGLGSEITTAKFGSQELQNTMFPLRGQTLLLCCIVLYE